MTPVEAGPLAAGLVKGPRSDVRVPNLMFITPMPLF
jgi:hypothetical protein